MHPIAFLFVSLALPPGDGTIRAPARIPLGQGAASICAGNFLRDGKCRLAVAHGSATITILARDPARRDLWEIEAALTVGAGCFFLRSADLDEDGVDDLVIADPGTSTWIVPSNGDGTFRTAVRIGTDFMDTPRAVAIGDWNLDGHLDLAPVCHPWETIKTYLGRGDGTFEQKDEILAGSQDRNHDIAAMDYDQDGRLDLVVAVDGFGVVRLKGAGDGRFGVEDPVESLGRHIVFLAPADLDGNSFGDLVAIERMTTEVDPPYEAHVGVGQAGGTFTKTASFAGIWPSFAVADIDRDGRSDLILPPKNEVRLDLHRGAGDGSFQSPVALDLPARNPAALLVADLDLDGAADVIFPGWDAPCIAVSWGRKDPALLDAEASLGGFPDVSALAIADLDRDGRPDLLLASRSKQVLAYMDPGADPARLSQPSSTVTATASFSSLEAVDLDGDGVPDLAGTNVAAGAALAAFLDSSGSIRGEVSLPAGMAPGPIAIGFADPDALPDLAVPCAVPATVALFRNLGGGSFAEASTVATVAKPRRAALADLDRDGSCDLAVLSDAVLGVHFGRGGGGFSGPTSVLEDGASGLVSLEAGDLDGDGETDLLAGNGGASRVEILLGRAGRSFASAPALQASGSPGSIVLADLDGNGFLDVAAAIEGAAAVEVFPNGGTAGFARPASYLLRCKPTGLGATDLDADGAIDLVAWSAMGAAVLFGRPADHSNPTFRRGDGNGDRSMDISDAVSILSTLFLGGGQFTCREAADANDDAGIDIADPIAILGSLFLGAGALPAPGPASCGPDPTPDDLGCESACP